MAKNETDRIRPIILATDEAAYIAIQALGDYQPVKAAYSRASLAACHDALASAREIEVRAENALKAARDNAVSAEWEFHNSILGAKAQVIAQYGDDSNEVQSLGLKKKSERKAPVRHKAAAG